jgi:hypothetical protein
VRNLADRLRGPRALWRAWRADKSGATLVQFIAVLPVLVLITVGMWSLFQMYSAQQTLCEGTWQAARYLQVEGPHFDEDVGYPGGWIPYATDIINTELKSNAMTKMEITDSDVTIFPQAMRVPPQEQAESRADKVTDAWFFVRASVDVPNPLAFLVNSEGEDGTLRITCQKTAYYETEPLRSTDSSHAEDPLCPQPPPLCTAGPPPTVCHGPNCPTPDPCPCRRR